MRYPASETAEKHARILNEAARLFRERGFSGVSVSEIMKATGLTHGPFYNHFASKEALMAESLARTSATSLADLEASAQTPQAMLAYIERYLSIAHRDAPGEGCLMAALASEIRHEPAVKGGFTTHLKAAIDKLTARFPSASKRRGRADSIRLLSSMVGALILARAVDDEALSEEILKEVRSGLR